VKDKGEIVICRQKRKKRRERGEGRKLKLHTTNRLLPKDIIKNVCKLEGTLQKVRHARTESEQREC
jgi:hypothetical protein